MRPLNLFVSIIVMAAPAAAAGEAGGFLPVSQATRDALAENGRDADILLVQVLLDRSRHSPGVIDGIAGRNTSRAISAFERAQGLPVDGKPDREMLERLMTLHPGQPLKRYRITPQDAAGPFRNVPAGMEAKSEMRTLAYGSPPEALAEKFHMSQRLIRALNPGADFAAPGVEILVAAPGEDPLAVTVARIEVDKSASALRAYDEAGKLLATYPATIGSGTFPSPTGRMAVRAVAHDPAYYFDPSGRDWGPDRRLTIAPGPNNPVGTTWIDLSKDGYGIHGTPEPKLIGKTSSHGCVRLTNWDARELARAVRQGTIVEFIGG